jgi:hypothetical protein
MIPVTVEVALLLPFRDSYFPMSAAQAEDMRLFKPLMKKPSKNIYTKRTANGSPYKANTSREKAIKEARITAMKATGERLP